MNLLIFVALLFAFAYVALTTSRPSDAKALLLGGSLRANAISLIATDVTLGTGVVYLFGGAAQNGALFLLIPIATAGGYFLQARYVDNVLPAHVRSSSNVLRGLGEEIGKQLGVPSSFAMGVSLCLVFTFVLVLAFEIFASSSIVTPLLVATPTPTTQAIVSLGVFATTVTYALIGGVRATHRVDFIQAPLVVVGVIALAIAVVTTPAKSAAPVMKLDAQTLINVTAASLAAIATQFYSILNWTTAASVGPSNQRSLFRVVGVGTGVILLIFVALGLVATGNGVDFNEVLGTLGSMAHSSSIVDRAIGLGALCGFAAVLFTTTDAIVVAATHFVTENVVPVKQALSPSDELARARRIGFGLFVVSFFVLMALNYLQPDPFYLLLSMVGGIGAFAPFIFVVGWVSRTPPRLAAFSNGVVWSFFGLFVVIGVTNAVLLRLAPRATGYVGLAAMLTGFVVSVVVARTAPARSA